MLSVLFHRRLVLMDDSNGVPFSPARVLSNVNRAICSELSAPGLFLTAAYCLLDTDSWSATIALAGHPPALLARYDVGIEKYARTGPAIGLTPDATYRNESFTLEHGDRILLYTDGLLDSIPDAAAARTLLETTLTDLRVEGHAVVDSLARAAYEGTGNIAADDRDDITLLLLEARHGTSRFDNGASAAPGAVTRGATGTPVLFYGESEERSFFALRGRGSWLHADAFGAAASGILEEGRSVVLDLADCEHLDSTFLGTVHDLARTAGSGRGEFALQHVPSSIRALFEELDMNHVLDNVRDAPLPLPDVRPLVEGEDAEGTHTRILRAHEELAALSARNREKFLGVVESMRVQLGD
jgi:anti-anti-sigma regulatory factor